LWIRKCKKFNQLFNISKYVCWIEGAYAPGAELNFRIKTSYKTKQRIIRNISTNTIVSAWFFYVCARVQSWTLTQSQLPLATANLECPDLNAWPKLKLCRKRWRFGSFVLIQESLIYPTARSERRESLVIASGVVNARRRSGWAGRIRMSFFLFSSISFFCKFWNIRWIKKCSDLKILFWKTVQIKTCSIQNLFNFEFHVQIRKICSNSNLFKFKFVQTRICSNSNLFKLDYV
jgi:hypothetical protein